MSTKVTNWLRHHGEVFIEHAFQHNMIDPHLMSRIVGLPVSRQDFALEEDLILPVADGVTWRRRRFRFLVEKLNGHREWVQEGLCINELTIDSNCSSDLEPAFAADFPHLVDFSEIENAYWQTSWASGALRHCSGEKATRLYANLGSLLSNRGGSDFREIVQALWELQNASGPVESIIDRLGPIEPHLIDMEDGEFSVARWLPAFTPSRLVQCDERIIAATNAGFFLNFPEEYNDGISALHQPLGGHVQKGRLVVPPWIARPALFRLVNGASFAQIFEPKHIELRINGCPPVPLHLGHFAENPHGSVWRFFDGEQLAPPADAVELVFSGNLLISVGPARAETRPPFGGAVVWVTGEHAEAALQPNHSRRISLALRPFPEGDVEWAISGGPFLVRNASRVTEEMMFTQEIAGEFHPAGPAPTRFPFDAATTRAPRTALGTTSSGGWKIVVVDGRRNGDHSMGVTLEGLAQLMQTVGCETALNLDGGGSSVMAIDGLTHEHALGDHIPFGVVNIPSDEGARERIVPVFLTVKARE